MTKNSCELCGQGPVTVHLTHTDSTGMVTIDLCEECARKHGVHDPARFRLADLLSALKSKTENGPEPK